MLSQPQSLIRNLQPMWFPIQEFMNFKKKYYLGRACLRTISGDMGTPFSRSLDIMRVKISMEVHINMRTMLYSLEPMVTNLVKLFKNLMDRWNRKRSQCQEVVTRNLFRHRRNQSRKLKTVLTNWISQQVFKSKFPKINTDRCHQKVRNYIKMKAISTPWIRIRIWTTYLMTL